MSSVGPDVAEKSREWRHKVFVTARIRMSSGWGDARILNVSSRGLMIRMSQPASPGSMIELRRGDQVIFAKVVWQSGTRAGLRSDSILPVTELICVSEKLGDTPPPWVPGSASRRASAFRNDRTLHHYRGRAMQFVAILAIAGMAAFGIGSAALATLGAPLAQMEQALRR